MIASIPAQGDSVDRSLATPGALTRLALVALWGLIALGLLMRVVFALEQPIAIDEITSYLAGEQTAAQGIPLLPSGVLYLHGATLSYLLAPLTTLGWIQPSNFEYVRLINVVAGAVAVYLTYRLAQNVGASRIAALFAAALVALDPNSVQWGGRLRMYALAQVFTLCVALFFIKTLPDAPDESRHPEESRAAIGLVLVFWLAVFSHLATALLWPIMAVIALFTYGKRLFTTHRKLTAALILCLGAPITLILLSGTVGAGAATKIATRPHGVPGVGFLGDHLVQIRHILHPNPTVWLSLFEPGALQHLLPFMVTAASTALLVIVVLQTSRGLGLEPASRRVLTLLMLYWGPVLGFAMIAYSSIPRYGLFLVPLGSVIMAVALQHIVTFLDAVTAAGTSKVNRSTLLAVGLGVLVLLHDVTGVSDVLADAQDAEDLSLLPHYVSEWRHPDEPVATMIGPTLSAFYLGDRDHLVFLPGGEGSGRALTYTRGDSFGNPIDYWLGVPVLTTPGELCTFLLDSPNGWVMSSGGQWERFDEEMRSWISATSAIVYEGKKGLVLRVRPAEEWDAETESGCRREVKRWQRRAGARAGDPDSSPQALDDGR